MGRLAALVVSTLLVTGCRSPSGDCTGQVGVTPVGGELGGETKLVLGGGDLSGRIARMVLDYGEGDSALFVDMEIFLPANQELTAVPFGPDAPPPETASGGRVSRFRITRPAGAPAVSTGVVNVRLASAESVEGSFDVQFADDSSLRCTFDVTGKTAFEDDDVPIEPPLGPIEPPHARAD